MLLPKGFDVGAGFIPALTPQFICNGCLRSPNLAIHMRRVGAGVIPALTPQKI